MLFSSVLVKCFVLHLCQRNSFEVKFPFSADVESIASTIKRPRGGGARAAAAQVTILAPATVESSSSERSLEVVALTGKWQVE